MDFAWRVIGSLTFGLMMSFMTGDFFVENLHGLTLASQDHLAGCYYILSLLFFSALAYLMQSKPWLIWKNRSAYAFFTLIAVSLGALLLLVFDR